MKLFHGTIDIELNRLKQAIERFPVLLSQLSHNNITLEKFHETSKIDRIMGALSIATTAISYLEENNNNEAKTQLPLKYKNELAGLINSLNLPSEECKKEVRGCLDLIKDGASYADLTFVTTNLIRTICRAFCAERDSSLGFLEEFYENINQIQNSISENITLEEEIAKSSKDSNASINLTISNINSNLENENLSFVEISKLIKKQLSSLGDIVKEHSHYLSMQDKLLLDLTEIETRITDIRNNAASFKEELKDVTRKSKTEPLTGLYNRLSFESVMEKELAIFQKDCELQKGIPFYVMLIDINDFKSKNNTYGTNVGDKILRVVAYTLKQSVRSSDFLAHLESDKYALIVHETQPENIHRIASKLITAIKGIPFHYNTQKVSVSISVAARKVREDTIDSQMLLDELTDDMRIIRTSSNNSHFSIC